MLPFVLFQPTEVEFHLPFIRRPETAEFEVDGEQLTQAPMEEEQVQVIVLAIHGNSLLPSDKAEVRTEFQQESLQVAQDGSFQFLLAVSVFQSEKVEQVRVTEDQIGARLPLVAQGGIASDEHVEIIATGEAFSGSEQVTESGSGVPRNPSERNFLYVRIDRP